MRPVSCLLFFWGFIGVAEIASPVCSSMVAGAVVLFLWPFLPFSGSIHRVFPAMLLSTVLYLFFTQIRENTADERVDTLFAHSSS
jgi:Na+/pantothenate symporter